MNSDVLSPPKTKVDLTCAHCGLPAKTGVREGALAFCCHGCQAAYHLFSVPSSESCPVPATEARPVAGSDDPELLQRFVREVRGDAVRISLKVPTVSCVSCVQVLERLPDREPGILAAEVRFAEKELWLWFQPARLGFSQLTGILNRLGYPPDLTYKESREEKKADSQNRTLLIKMAVAGFCSGNIMLLSFPDYLGLEDNSFRDFLAWLNLILSLPVMAFSSTGYWQSMYTAVRTRVLDLDVPIGLGILATFILSVYQVFTHTGTGFFDSVTALVFFLLCGKWVQSQTFRFLSFERDYTSFFPLRILRQEGDKEVLTLTTNLRSGDMLRIRNREIVPCDGVVTEGQALIDYSFVNGETQTVTLPKGSEVMAGGIQSGGSFRMRVTREMSQSQISRLWNHPVFSKEGGKRLSGFSDAVARWFTPSVLALAGLVGVYWLYQDPSRSLFAFLSVLVVACPCTLALAFPVAMGNVMRHWGKAGFFLRNADVVEKLSLVDSLVFDKTGTLTTNLASAVRFEGEALKPEEKVLLYSVLANSCHPLSRSICLFLGQGREFEVADFSEVQGSGLEATCGGVRVRMGSAKWLGLHAGATEDAAEVWVEIEGRVRGHFEVKNEVLPFVPEMLERLSQTHHLHLLSGDKDLGQSFWKSLFGRFSGSKTLFARKPQEKLDFIESLQKSGHRVAMLGDGLNDAGALKRAELGIALAESTAQFTPASDAILLSSLVNRLPDFIRQSGRAIFWVKVCFAASLVYNFIGIGYAATGTLAPMIAAILMPLNSLTVIALAWFGTQGIFRVSVEKAHR